MSEFVMLHSCVFDYLPALGFPVLLFDPVQFSSPLTQFLVYESGQMSAFVFFQSGGNEFEGGMAAE